MIVLRQLHQFAGCRQADAIGIAGGQTFANEGDVHAVFDGSEQPDAQPPTGPRRLVRVTFSPPSAEADDVILDLVHDLKKPLPPLGGPQRIDFYAAFCDGHVQKIPAKTSEKTLRCMINWQNTEPFTVP